MASSWRARKLKERKKGKIKSGAHEMEERWAMRHITLANYGSA